jgi:hypothetical protein
MQLNPEVLSLRKVQHTAEIIELAHLTTKDSHTQDPDAKAQKRPEREKTSGKVKISEGSSNPPPKASKGNHDQYEGKRGNTTLRNWDPRNCHQSTRQSEPTREERMSKEEHDRLASEGRCFVCKQTGHISRSCPN